jgi:hypothetical protein
MKPPEDTSLEPSLQMQLDDLLEEIHAEGANDIPERVKMIGAEIGSVAVLSQRIIYRKLITALTSFDPMTSDKDTRMNLECLGRLYRGMVQNTTDACKFMGVAGFLKTKAPSRTQLRDVLRELREKKSTPIEVEDNNAGSERSA